MPLPPLPAVVNIPDSKAKVTGLKTHIYLTLVGVLIALCLSFTICNVGIIAVIASQYYVSNVHLNCFNICKVFSTVSTR